MTTEIEPVELVPLTPEEIAALEEIAVLRQLYAHRPGCECHRCGAARAVWVGFIDQLDELAAGISADDARHLLESGRVKRPEDIAGARSAVRYVCKRPRCGGTGEKACDACGAPVGAR